MQMSSVVQVAGPSIRDQNHASDVRASALCRGRDRRIASENKKQLLELGCELLTDSHITVSRIIRSHGTSSSTAVSRTLERTVYPQIT